MTTTRTRTRITTVAEAGDAVFATMDRYADFGAYDTEPRGEFAEVVAALIHDRDVEIPQNARDWQLYSTMKGSFYAAKSLTRATERFVKLANTDRKGLVSWATYHYGSL